jgi:hypothetical protein
MDLDPRAKTKVSVETVSGVITDRAIELINMLNNAIGAQGQLGAQEKEIIFNDGDGNGSTQSVGNYLVAPSAEDAQWKEDERVYYQATHKRIDQISGELDASIDQIKDDMIGNITNLFDTLAAKENDRSNGPSINDLEAAVQAATTTEELLQAQQALEAKTVEILTSEEALNEMMNIFFENFNITIERINDEIFNKLHDFDDNYANGASDIENEKFFYERAYLMPGDVEGEDRPVLILNSAADVFNTFVNDQRIIHEDRFGPGTYTQAMADQFVRNEVEVKFTSGELKLSDAMIDAIIADRNITEEELLNFKEMKDFTDLVSFNKLIELTGAGDRQAGINALLQDHLQIATPKYYEDQRTIFDILNGKNNDMNSGNTKDRVFSSVDSQMKNVAQGIQDLYSNGYEKAASSNLQINIRNNPFAAIEYLETEKPNQEGIFLELIDQQVGVLISRQVRHLKNYAEKLVAERQEILRSENPDQARIDEINELIGLASEAEIAVRNYDPSRKDEIKAKLAKVFPEINSATVAPKDFQTFTNALDPEAKFSRANKLLYVMENTEAGKKNLEYSGRKLPTPQADGTIPPDTMPIPPLLSPTPLSAVIARIGDELVTKSQALINGDEIPTTEWMANNTQTLLTINDQLGNLGASSAGEAFLASLRENFKDVVKNIFTAASPLKDVQDQTKDDLVAVDLFIGDGAVINGNRPFSTNLNSITNAFNNDITNGANFINRAGLENVKEFMEENIERLDIDYDAAQANVQAQLAELYAKDPKTGEDLAEIARLEAELIRLRADENALEAAQELMYGAGGTAANPNEGSLLDTFNNYNAQMNQIISDRGGLNGQDRNEFLANAELELAEEYKDAVVNYSNSLTDFDSDADGDGEADLVTALKNSLDETSLDLDGNGTNDFVDFKNMVGNLTNLSDNIVNTFGGKDASEGGIDKQSIRRMLLLMFVFSMLEAGEWQARRDDANVDRYVITP